MEKEAEIIGQSLKGLQKKCANETAKKTISIDEIVFIMEFMADQLSTEHRHLFQEHFIGHLKVFSQLTQMNANRTDDITDSFNNGFKKITKLLCKVIAIENLPPKFLNRLLAKWLQCLEHMPSGSKYRVYRKIKRDLRQNCVRFLIRATRYSMQMQILDIICSLYDTHSKANDSPMKLCAFLKNFEGVVDTQKNGDFVKAATKIFGTESASLAFKEKHCMLSALNGHAKDRSIHSMPITALKLKTCGKAEQEFDSGWMHLSTVSGTVEFSVSENGQFKTMCIETRKLHDIEMVESTEVSSLEVKFVFISKAQQKAEQETSNGSSNWIQVIMAADCIKPELIALLRQVFPAIDLDSDVKLIKSSSSPFSSDSEQLINGQNSQTSKVNLSRISTVAEDSPFQDGGGGDDNGVSVQDIVLELHLSNGFSRNTLESSPRKRRATVPIDVDKTPICGHDGDGDDDESEKSDERLAKRRIHGRAKTFVVPSAKASTAAANSIDNQVNRSPNNVSDVKFNQMLSMKITLRNWIHGSATVMTRETDNVGFSSEIQLLANQQ